MLINFQFINVYINVNSYILYENIPIWLENAHKTIYCRNRVFIVIMIH